MTDKEKAIVMAYTGVVMLKGDKIQIFYKYVEKIMGRPILTHEMAQLATKIKEKSKDDFMTLCKESNEKNTEIREVIDMLTNIKNQAIISYYDPLDTLIKYISVNSFNFVINEAIKFLEAESMEGKNEATK